MGMFDDVAICRCRMDMYRNADCKPKTFDSAWNHAIASKQLPKGSLGKKHDGVFNRNL